MSPRETLIENIAECQKLAQDDLNIHKGLPLSIWRGWTADETLVIINSPGNLRQLREAFEKLEVVRFVVTMPGLVTKDGQSLGNVTPERLREADLQPVVLFFAGDRRQNYVVAYAPVDNNEAGDIVMGDLTYKPSDWKLGAFADIVPFSTRMQ